MENNDTAKKEIVVGVAGQPNVGKSTLFNVLTGRRVHVANWPGVTVEKHEGIREYMGYRLRFIDLPGIYGFSATTIEEKIARRFILEEKPDVLLVLVDSINPERTMYLAIQALEMYTRVIIVFTKIDETHARGIHINYEALNRRLGVPVVAVSSATGQGINELLDKIVEVASSGGRRKPLRIDYGELEPFILSVEQVLEKNDSKIKYPIRWVSIRLLEGDRELEEYVRRMLGEKVLIDILKTREEIRRIFHRSPEELFAQKRFEYIEKLLRGVVVRVHVGITRRERITRYFYHPWLGPFLSIFTLIIVFLVAFSINTGFPLNVILADLGYPGLAEAVENYSLGGLIEAGFNALSNYLYSIMGESIISSLVINGIIGGVGAVAVFLPLIMMVAFFLAVLEDSGLSPRIAVSLHNWLTRIGVSGHAVFPMLLGFGCNVPAVMSTRAVPDPRERIRLIMTIPFIPCQARLVVILAFASALSGLSGALLILYGYVAAFIAFSLVNRSLYWIDKKRGRVSEPELLLELPPIHKPIPRVVWWHVWDSTKHFLKKAGTIIFLLSILIWFLTSYTPSLTYTGDPSQTIGAYLARLFAPFLYPIGLRGDQAWIIAFALIIGFVAKESVISALTITTGADTARDALRLLKLTDVQIASITVFMILYVPCMATLAVMLSETRSWKIVLASIGIMLSIAYVGMLFTYMIGLLL